jgi:N-acetylmuramoyl-L-alanine amidase
MKRWILVSCLVLISALGVLIPAGAQASTIAAGKLTSGKPVKATISKSGQQLKYTFAAARNKNVTFDVTHFDLTDNGSGGGVNVYYYEPGSSSVYTSCYFTSNNYCNFTTPESGTWKVVLVPSGASVGSLTLTFANDVPTVALTSGKPVTTAIKFSGQEAGYTFAAKANKNVTFDVTHFNFTDNGSGGGVNVYYYEPGSSSSYTSCYFTSNNYCNFTAPESGTWSIALVPSGASVGSLTLTFANDVPTVALTSGKPVTTAIKYAGQEAGYTFAAKANKNVTFHVTHFNFTDNGSGGGVNYYFYEPGSSSSYTSCYFTSNNYCNFTTPESGTWSIALVPSGASVGSLTLELT